MSKIKSIIASSMVALALMTGCDLSQTQINTAKDAITKVTLTITFAEAYITAVESTYAGNEKVTKALDATRSALAAVRTALVAASAGLDKDYEKLTASAAILAQRLVELSFAIKDAATKK